MRDIVVKARPGVLGATALAAAVFLGSPPVAGQDRDPGSVAGDAPSQPKGAGAPSAWPAKTPIRDSVDRAVDELIRKHFSGCGRGGGDEVPCFPVSVERQWQYSVAESLEHLEFDDSPSPNRPPTVDEMAGARPGPLSASGSVGFDPVCKGKQLLNALTGKSRTYYLYRVWDEDGEHAVLRDRPIEAADYGGAPRFHYVALGSFGDECEAMAAWRKALREARANRSDRGDSQTSPPR